MINYDTVIEFYNGGNILIDLVFGMCQILAAILYIKGLTVSPQVGPRGDDHLFK